jgi:hypothetical protein
VLVEDGKNAHLRELDGAKERLSLYRANVLDYDSLRAAFSSCDGVFHVASPIMNDDPVSFHLLIPTTHPYIVLISKYEPVHHHRNLNCFLFAGTFAGCF